jgi:adenylate cyclase
MPTEIERKFLIIKENWEVLKKPIPAFIRQGYIAGDNTVSVRVRIQNNIAILNIKKDIDGISRYEFEYTIPPLDGEIMMEQLCRTLIEKHRYRIPIDQHIWEVDVFEGRNKGLIVAEIELSSADEVYTKPPWIGQEVTFDTQYLNTSLAEKPFDTWD